MLMDSAMVLPFVHGGSLWYRNSRLWGTATFRVLGVCDLAAAVQR
jgi:hypothetical protein